MLASYLSLNCIRLHMLYAMHRLAAAAMSDPDHRCVQSDASSGSPPNQAFSVNSRSGFIDVVAATGLGFRI